MHHTILCLLMGFALFPFPAVAQHQGVIYYTSNDSPATYQINGDGTGQGVLSSTLYLGWPTTRADYPGGRQFVRKVAVGTIPGTTQSYYDIVSWNLSGATKTLTAFAGPLYIAGAANPIHWSNDGQDSFLSFYVYDPATSSHSLYRAHVTAAEIADSLYQPLVPGDSRLEFVGTWPLNYDYAWDRTGTKVYYVDDRIVDRQKLRAKIVGVGQTMDDDPVVFDQGITGVRPSTGGASPTSDQVVFRGMVIARSGKLTSEGYISINPATGTWQWLLTDTSSGGLSFSADCSFSPDGTGLAFGAMRTVTSKKTTTRVYGIYKMPATGGPFVLLTESPKSQSLMAPMGWCW